MENKKTFFATFNKQDIGKAISRLVSFVEDEDYVCQEICYGKKTGMQMFGERFDSTESFRYMTVVVAPYDFDEFTFWKESNINLLMETGYAINLSNDADDSITFYRDDSGELLPTINFGKYPYVREFIDSLISYKEENESECISFEVMEKLRIEFIKNGCEDSQLKSINNK